MTHGDDQEIDDLVTVALSSGHTTLKAISEACELSLIRVFSSLLRIGRTDIAITGSALLSPRARILDRSASLITGPRASEYGPPQESFARIAGVWNWWLSSSDRDPVILPRDVAMMMALLKVARAAQSSDHADSYVDLAGYAAIAGELAGVELDP